MIYICEGGYSAPKDIDVSQLQNHVQHVPAANHHDNSWKFQDVQKWMFCILDSLRTSDPHPNQDVIYEALYYHLMVHVTWSLGYKPKYVHLEICPKMFRM